MGLIKGGALRLIQSGLYAINFCCAAIILGIYSYFLSVLADRHRPIPTWEKAVEGISGVAIVYTIFAVILTCCLGGVSFFAFLALVLDILFVGGMLAIAILTRHGASSCRGTVNTPLGIGNANSNDGGWGQSGFGTGSGENTTYKVSSRLACRYNTVVFAVSIIAAFLFIITAIMQVMLVRHHKKEKRYGPSPKNNYTSGYGKRKFWQRKPKNNTRDAELATAGTATTGGLTAPQNDLRPSHETGYTGSTVAAPGNDSYDKVTSGTGVHGHAPHGTRDGYYTQPQGTGVNPYGYDNQPNNYTNGHATTATNY